MTVAMLHGGPMQGQLYDAPSWPVVAIECEAARWVEGESSLSKSYVMPEQGRYLLQNPVVRDRNGYRVAVWSKDYRGELQSWNS